MQRTLVLIVPAAFQRTELENRLRAAGNRVNNTGEELEVREPESTSYVLIAHSTERDLAVQDYLENDELGEAFRASVADCDFFVLMANSLPFLRTVVGVVLEYLSELDGDAWLDDDYGAVLAMREVAGRLAANPSWDFRQ
jgi:hypothetical protein